jgi:hypothetical protein
VDEDILAAIVRLDEAVTLGGIEPFDGAVGHVAFVLPDESPSQARPHDPSGEAPHNLWRLGSFLRFQRSSPEEIFAGATFCRPKATDCGSEMRTLDCQGQPDLR